MATNDVITLAEAKTYLGITSSADDDLLQEYVTSVSLALDALVGPIVERTVSNELHDGGGTAVFLEDWPVASITTVTEYKNTASQALAAETNVTKTGNDYLAYEERGVVVRRRTGSDWCFPVGRKNVDVTYVAGRFADTASVDDRFKQAASMMLDHLWRRDQGLSSAEFGAGGANNLVGFNPFGLPSFAIPLAVRELLADEVQREIT